MTISLYSRLAVFLLALALLVFVAAGGYVFQLQIRTILELSEQVQTLANDVGRLKIDMRALASENASFHDTTRHIAVSLAENKLYLMEGMDPIRTMKAATGTGKKFKLYGHDYDFSTPKGTFQITRKETDPIWIAPDWDFFEKGETDPIKVAKIPLSERSFHGHLGKYRLMLRDGVGIHGTTEANSIGRYASHGCIRLGDKDLEVLFNSVDSGAKVYIY